MLYQFVEAVDVDIAIDDVHVELVVELAPFIEEVLLPLDAEFLVAFEDQLVLVVEELFRGLPRFKGDES